jgi:hypothetical protein
MKPCAQDVRNVGISGLAADAKSTPTNHKGLKLEECSLSLDTCRLDYWPPLLDFGLLKRAKSLWSLLIDRRSFHAKIG